MQKELRQLDAATIRSACSNSSYVHGQTYFHGKRITEFHLEIDQPNVISISSKVKGSHSKPYKQQILLKWQDDSLHVAIEGRCSCPIGYNCKHVAAVCLDYQKRLSNQFSADENNICFNWLESLDESQSDAADQDKDFLAYILKPQIRGNKPDVSIEFLVTKQKKSGGLNKGRVCYLSSLHNSFAYGYKPPGYLQTQDLEIIKLLYSQPNPHMNLPLLRAWNGGLAMTNMLNSGRLFWRSLANPLAAGEKRGLDLAWKTDVLGDYHLTVQTQPVSILLQTDPPYYVDGDQLLVGRVDSQHFTSQQLRKICTAPPVPAQQAEKFSQRLILEFPHLKLPSPKAIEIHEIRNLPAQPRLKLQGIVDNNRSVTHQLTLSFAYGPHHLLAHPHQEDYALIHSSSGYLRIFRDLPFEQTCIDEICKLGFVSADELPSTELIFVATGKKDFVDFMVWQDFLEEGLPALQEAGWLIETDSSFKLNFFNASAWEAEIEENSNAWFEMRFNIEIQGRSLPLLPLIMPALENYDLQNLPKTLTVPISEYDYLTLPCEKLKPFLKVLYEIFGSFAVNETGAIKLSKFDAAGLAELETHSYGLFAMKGGKSILELGRKIQNFKGIESVRIPDNLQATLRNYQLQGLNWMQFLREYQFSGILADDMGLGKTLQTLSHLLLEKQSGRMTLPCLIVAPTSLMSNWRREANRFTPDLKVLVLQGSDRKHQFDKIPDYDLILTTYPLLTRDDEFLINQAYYYLILDEAQIVKNPKAKAAKTVRHIKTQHRLCLTGTPMENHLGELWAQFDFLMPGFLGDNAAFKRNYQRPIEIHGDDDQRRRLSKRIAPFMLRRSKQQVAEELPLKTEIIRAVALGPKQAMLYESIRLTMERKVQQAIAEKGLSRSHITILDALLKLRQACCDPRTLPLHEAQKLKDSAKLALLMEMLPELLEEGRRILVFSQFTRMIALIENELNAKQILYAKLTGQTRNRDEAIDQFKSGAANVFLISLKAGGVGLNLTEADTVIVYDPWWNPAVENQAADRAHRIGQDKPVFVYKLITENTVEEKILEMQLRKSALAESIYQGDQPEDATLNLTTEDLAALFEPL
jgi:superfamily II DNA or RNA helicase